eukprot:11167942-Lingulodinium_polyedra.AAC.1
MFLGRGFELPAYRQEDFLITTSVTCVGAVVLQDITSGFYSRLVCIVRVAGVFFVDKTWFYSGMRVGERLH